RVCARPGGPGAGGPLAGPGTPPPPPIRPGPRQLACRSAVDRAGRAGREPAIAPHPDGGKTPAMANITDLEDEDIVTVHAQDPSPSPTKATAGDDTGDDTGDDAGADDSGDDTGDDKGADDTGD